MYVAVIPNRSSPPAILLRESYSENGKTKKRTLKNLSDWPAERIEQLRAVLRGEELLPATNAVEIVRSLPMATSSPPSPPHAASNSMPCCPVARRNADVIWHSR
jgi:hypothetical protein